jgi:hypothetical protein
MGLGTMRGAVLEETSLGTAGGLPCLDVGTGKSGPVVARDGMVRWLEHHTTQSAVWWCNKQSDATTYASPPHVKEG